jgi:four helix bundle protein
MTEIPNKKKFDLEDRTRRFAKGVVSLCRTMEKRIINKEIISQLVRPSGSVGANYLEANDAMSKKDFAYRIRVCRKEAKESAYWLDLLKEGNEDYECYISKLEKEAVELKKIFSKIAEKLK